MTTKECFKCGEAKPRTEFYRHSMMADGLLGKCRECTKRDVARHTKKMRRDPEWLAKERARCVEKQTRLGPVYKAAAPEKARARYRLHNAVARGYVVRPSSCQDCGEQCHPDAHHEDYSNPLDVRWLCRRCHMKAHGRLRADTNTFED